MYEFGPPDSRPRWQGYREGRQCIEERTGPRRRRRLRERCGSQAHHALRLSRSGGADRHGR